MLPLSFSRHQGKKNAPRLLATALALLFNFAAFADADTDSLKNLLRTKPKNEATILAELCWNYKYSHPDSAKSYGLLAAKKAKAQKNDAVLSTAYHNLAIVYGAESKFEEAINYNQQALALKRKLKDQMGIANSLNNLGGIYDQQGNYIKAVDLYKEAYAIYKKVGNPESLAQINLNLGIVLKAQKQYDNVLKYYREAYQIYKNLNKTFEVGASEANLGSFFLEINQPDSSIFYSKLAEKKFKALKIENFLPVVRANLGIAYAKKNDLASSNHYLKLAAKGHQLFNNKKELSFVQNGLSENYGTQNISQALLYAKEALNNAEECKSLPEIMKARRQLATLYQYIGNTKLALQNFQLYSDLKDSLFTIEKNKQMSQFNVVFETEKKDRRITELDQQSTIQQLEIKEKNILLYAAIVLIGFSIFTAYLMIKKRRAQAQMELNAEKNRQQELRVKEVFDAEERERRRIAEDLHDGVGQTLSAALMNLNGLIAKADLKDPQQSALAERSVALLSESYDEMRAISHQMIPNALLKSGLAAAVREFVNKINQQTLKITLDINGLQEKLNENVETVIYRVIQEATNNVIKYAKASKLSIQINRDEDGISLSIEDNGIGFDPSQLKKSQGIGFKNMYNRVASLNGTLEIDSQPGKGTLLNFYLPA
ncbi:hypothetical protein BCY91_16365 [Pelobium manganitolerans]|uniref:Oxygen sensor histidine kinase NreB n=1 Tax=Pelobium manganitolerans TaxID=1842495 RepID=A0A419S8C4_9SPHI|nr:sensor histidine kinase [Pelobium manganitolerans]RKD18015.1 hypothetical protein BCY91_16365 [Pelobium manganitolerans]